MEKEYSNELYILIFKTNIEALTDLHLLTPIFNTNLGIQNWSVDISDCDKVLRVQSWSPDQKTIIQLVENAGYTCEEMID